MEIGFERFSARRSVGTERSAAVHWYPARKHAWYAAICSLLLMTIVPPCVGLAVNYASFLGLLIFPSGLVPLAVYAGLRGFTRLNAALETTVLVLMLGIAALVLSYAVMRLALPLADQRLAGWDHALALNSIGIVSRVGQLPALSNLLAAAYGSFGLQLMLLPATLAILGHTSRAYEFFSGLVAIFLVSIAISTFFPAVGTFAYFNADRQVLGSVNAFFGHHFLDSFHAVRSDPDFVLSVGMASGIVTFPSIHAAVAVLCGWASWRVGWLRVPGVLLNAAMFLSAVTHGAHYVVDVLAGGCVAAAVIALIAMLRSVHRADASSSARVALSDRVVPAGAAAAR